MSMSAGSSCALAWNSPVVWRLILHQTSQLRVTVEMLLSCHYDRFNLWNCIGSDTWWWWWRGGGVYGKIAAFDQMLGRLERGLAAASTYANQQLRPEA
jgi:hypothetical protein